MVTTINNIYLDIRRNRDIIQVYPQKSYMPYDMEYDGIDWVFTANEMPKPLFDIMREISDFIKANKL